MRNLAKYFLAFTVMGTGFYAAQQHRRLEPQHPEETVLARQSPSESAGDRARSASAARPADSLPVAALADVDRVPLLDADRAANSPAATLRDASTVTMQPTLRRTESREEASPVQSPETAPKTGKQEMTEGTGGLTPARSPESAPKTGKQDVTEGTGGLTPARSPESAPKTGKQDVTEGTGGLTPARSPESAPKTGKQEMTEGTGGLTPARSPESAPKTGKQEVTEGTGGLTPARSPESARKTGKQEMTEGTGGLTPARSPERAPKTAKQEFQPPDLAREYQPYTELLESVEKATASAQDTAHPRTGKKKREETSHDAPEAGRAANQAAEEAEPPRRHCIVEGDTLRQLAEKHLGSRDRYLEIFNANQDVLFDPQLIPIGVEIVIPHQTVVVAHAPRDATARNDDADTADGGKANSGDTDAGEANDDVAADWPPDPARAPER